MGDGDRDVLHLDGRLFDVHSPFQPSKLLVTRNNLGGFRFGGGGYRSGGDRSDDTRAGSASSRGDGLHAAKKFRML